MGKGDRRTRKGAAEKFALAATKPAVHPRDRRGTGTRKPGEDARTTVLAARCHHLGTSGDKDARKAAAAPHLGSDLGRVMERLCDGPDEIARLWAVWQGFCAAERTYRVRIIGQAGTPKGATIAMLPEKLEADTGHTIDTRTQDERNRDAVNGWMRWRGFVGQLGSKDMAGRLHQAEREDGPELWRKVPWTDADHHRHGLRIVREAIATAQAARDAALNGVSRITSTPRSRARWNLMRVRAHRLGIEAAEKVLRRPRHKLVVTTAGRDTLTALRLLADVVDRANPKKKM
jgi:hypothetical protein